MNRKSYTWLKSFQLALWFIATVVCMQTAVVPVYGQTDKTKPTDVAVNAPSVAHTLTANDFSEQKLTIRSIHQKLDAMEQKLLTAPTIPQTELLDNLAELSRMGDRLRAIQANSKSEIEGLGLQLKTLTPDGEKNDASAFSDQGLDEVKKRLNDELDQFKILIVTAEDLQKKISRIAHAIASIRRNYFEDRVFERFTFNDLSVADLTQDYLSFWHALKSSLALWWSYVLEHKPYEALGIVLISLILSILLWCGMRLLVGRFALKPGILSGESQQQLSLLGLKIHISRIVMPTATLSLFLYCNGYVMAELNVLNFSLEKIYHAIAINLILWVFIERILTVMFSPMHSSWRLVPLPVNMARLIYAMFLLIVSVRILGFILNDLVNIYSTSLLLTQCLSVVTMVLLAFCFGFLGIGLWGIKAHHSKQDGVLFAKGVRLIALVAGLGVVMFLLVGYLGLANIIGDIVMSTIVVICPVYIMLTTLAYMRTPGLVSETRIANALIKRQLVSSSAIDRLSSIMGLVLAFLMVALSLPFLLFPWYLDIIDILDIYKSVFTDFTIGNITFSLGTIFVGVLVFLVGCALTLLARRSFVNSTSASNLDTGIRDSLQRGIGYLGYLLAFVVAVISTGLDLSSLAIVAGALSIGVGFGLQNIVSNFVSGLILLIERPIKVGDWVVINTYQGIVKNIAVRATQIETFNGQVIFVPNSELINGQVGNWHYGNKRGRVDVPITISRQADTDKVKEILLAVGREYKRTMSYPAPNVVFGGVQDNAFLFELRVYIFDIDDIVTTSTELRLAILAALETAGIEVPYPYLGIDITQTSNPEPVKPALDSPKAPAS